MLIQSCRSCGARFVALDGKQKQSCTACGQRIEDQRGVKLSIPLGGADYSELQTVAASPREDKVSVS